MDARARSAPGRCFELPGVVLRHFRSGEGARVARRARAACRDAGRGRDTGRCRRERSGLRAREVRGERSSPQLPRS